MPSRIPGHVRHLCGIGLVLAALAAAATTIEGQTFDERIRVGGVELVLNGVGLRAVAWLKGYAAGLYLVERAHTPADVLALGGPKRVQLRMLLDVETAEFVKAIEKGMRRNHGQAEQAALKARELQFINNVQQVSQLRKGDVVNLDFLPGTGLLLSINGAVQGGPVTGEDFYAGVLRIFIGTRPVDKELKTGLLGGRT